MRMVFTRCSLFICAVALLWGLGGDAALAAPPADMDKRGALAEEMLAIRPVRVQVERAVDAYIEAAMRNKSERDKEVFRIAMLRALNVDALEKIAVEAYADTFTEAELSAMVEYYQKPEARSAAAKEGALTQKIGPEIIKILDQAAMKARTAP
ncbi:MAG: DUF2059 domain-containing protein [Alphaproteobacteria bacterium]|nr:DUF2059 domain-containing protein [Alphaproteobacteria bacterium]